MKAIQVMFDEKLLARLDAADEVQREGRPAVLRKAAEVFLRDRRRRSIAEGYRRGGDPQVGRQGERAPLPVQGFRGQGLGDPMRMGGQRQPKIDGRLPSRAIRLGRAGAHKVRTDSASGVYRSLSRTASTNASRSPRRFRTMSSTFSRSIRA